MGKRYTKGNERCLIKVIKNVENMQQFNDDKFTRVPLFQEGNTNTFLLNLLPGQTVPPHPHPNARVYVYVVEGEGICTVDEHVQTIAEKDVVHVYDQQVLSIENTGIDPMSLYVVLIKNS